MGPQVYMDMWGELSGVRGDFVRVSELYSWSFLGSANASACVCCTEAEEEEDWRADDDGNNGLHLVDGKELGVTVVVRNDDDDSGARWKASTAVREE